MSPVDRKSNSGNVCFHITDDIKLVCLIHVQNSHILSYYRNNGWNRVFSFPILLVSISIPMSQVSDTLRNWFQISKKPSEHALLATFLCCVAIALICITHYDN